MTLVAYMLRDTCCIYVAPAAVPCMIVFMGTSSLKRCASGCCPSGYLYTCALVDVAYAPRLWIYFECLSPSHAAALPAAPAALIAAPAALTAALAPWLHGGAVMLGASLANGRQLRSDPGSDLLVALRAFVALPPGLTLAETQARAPARARTL